MLLLTQLPSRGGHYKQARVSSSSFIKIILKKLNIMGGNIHNHGHGFLGILSVL